MKVLRLDYCQDESEDTATDLDLYLVDNETGEEVWYEQPRVPGLGRLCNDIRYGGAKTRDGVPVMGGNYEFICVEPDVDLGRCTLWLNKHLGVGTVLAEVSLYQSGRVVGVQKVEFESRKGDLGRQADNRAASGNWVRIDLEKLTSGQ
ncbi:hypothetical protein KOR34_24010 [Posidoniimonas corsicana]|uniref:Uncharacterized protein n=1 Tax=Posidoniimonas corsicana TaxID=1938618 RepID=A0A5C5VHM9_9BACT|nr:hypothetical protein [Posidoniimonas corsicana]TWT37450.1 hypothetical protein KOR34_24010 [Posidoniimonas corsicana]